MVRTSGIALFALLALAACGNQDSKVAVEFGSNRREAAPLDEGDVKVTSTDGALVLAVIGDSVVMQLSDSLRESVRAEVGKSADDAGALGATIAKAVGSAVGTAMGVTVRVPAEAVNDLRYENGELRFDVKGSHVNMTSSGKHSGNGGKFSERDAQAFIDAVRAAQARAKVM
jgi:hypothetical protein